jgi:hypothetical protein
MRIVGTSRIGQTSSPSRRDRPVVPAASAEMIATAPPLCSPPAYSLSRPDPFFITQLIATAEQSPQTRALRRADVSDVEAAYGAVANRQAGATGYTRRIA